jgi:hypothetical protein
VAKPVAVGSGSPLADARERWSWRDVALLAAGGVVLSLVMNWPLPLELGEKIPASLGDPLFQAWQVAWDGHALTHQPLDFFQANPTWPLSNSLAFSDALIGYTPIGLIGDGAQAALVRYDLLFLFAYALAFVSAGLLARELGAARAASWVAGAAFAYAPWRLAQNGHLNILSSGGIALSLFLLLRGYRRRQPGTVVVGWVVAAWQVSLGFNLGLQLLYLLAALATLYCAVWVARGRPRLDRSLVLASLAGAGLLVLTSSLLAIPYVQAAQALPESKRSLAEVARFSPPLEGLIAAPPESYVWGGVTSGVRSSLSWPLEQTLFPGLAILVLALVGLGSTAYPGRVRAGLAVAVVVCADLSLGLGVAHGWLGYRLLYDLAPGWQGLRTPGRITALTTLALALLAAAGCTRLGIALSARSRSRLPASAAQLAAGAIALCVVVVEGAGRLPLRPVPHVPAGQLGAGAPQYHLPSDTFVDERYMYWSTEGFPRIVNGEGSFTPHFLKRLRARTASFPDKRSAKSLRALGVNSVILHTELLPGTSWEGAERRSVAGLGLRRERRGGIVVFELRPQP